MNKFSAPVFDIKAIQEDGLFSGYGSIFGNRDSGGDIVVAGAYAKSLADHRAKGTRPRMFWQHMQSEPIGKWTDMSEDGKGLYVEGQLNMGVQRAREAYALLKNGDIDGLSIGYAVVSEEPDPKRNANLLKEVRLLEVSVVSMAMNARARVETVKSDSEQYAQLREKLAAGDLPSEREFEKGMRDAFGLTNSEAERVVRLFFKQAQGDPEVITTEPSVKGLAALARAVAAGISIRT